MTKSYVPEKGDFVFIDFNPQAGHRPALVISPKIYNGKTRLCVLCPITSSKKGYPFEVDCNSKEIKGVILADQVKNLDWKARGIKFKAKASSDVLEETMEKIKALLIDE